MKNNLLLLLLCIVSVSCSNGSTNIKNGTLPKRYEWAYGEWRAENSKFGEINLIIGGDYIQYNYPFCCRFNNCMKRTIKSNELPPIECFPKLGYQASNGNGYNPKYDNGRITLYFDCFDMECDISSHILLDRKERIIRNEDGDTFSKVKAKKNADDVEAVAKYQTLLDNSPLGGEWRQSNSRRTIRLLQNPNHKRFIVSNTGKVLINGSSVYELENSNRLKEVSLENRQERGTINSYYVKKTYYRNERSSQSHNYSSSNVVFNHEQDIFLYLTGHNFYNSDNKHTLSFTSSLELVVDGVMLTGAMRTIAFNQEEALLLGHCPQGGDIKLGVYGKLHCVVDATEKPYVAYSEQ